MSFKVVCLFETEYPRPDVNDFENIGAELVTIPCETEDEIISAAQDADALIAIYEPITRRVIENLPRCKLIVTPKTGVGNIDVDAATEHGICVANAGDYAKEEVSNHALALLLTCARKIVHLDRAAREGKWDTRHGPGIRKVWVPMVRLKGQTLGIIGLGVIGRTLVPKARPLGLRIIAYAPFVSQNVADELGVGMVELDQLLGESDFISIHAALTPQTQHMLGLEEFKKMKPTAYIINTARGALIDEKALYTALSQGLISGAALDLLETDACPLDHPLLTLDNVILTAHSAFYSEQSFSIPPKRPAMEVARIMQGEWPMGFVNPEVKAKFNARHKQNRES